MRNTSIEGLRGILMLWIILYHYTCQYNTIEEGHILSFIPTFPTGGIYGVMMFFVISGFFLHDKLINLGGAKNGITFLINRYWRLWPAYALSCIITFIVLKIIPLPEVRQSLELLLINLVAIVHPTIKHIDGAHWFIKSLVESYVLLSFLFLFHNKNTRYSILYVMVIGCFFLKFDNHILPSFVQGEALQFADSFLAIVLGICIKWLMQMNWNQIWGWSLAIIILWYYAYMDFVYIILIMIFLCIVLYGRTSYMQHLLGNRLLMTFGTYSYCWYLIHQMVGFSIMYHTIPNHSTCILWLIIPMSITFYMAVFIQKVTNILPSKIIN